MPYAVHPSIQYQQGILEGLQKKTGRSIAEWAELLENEGLADAKSRQAWLREQHKLGSTSAWLIAMQSLGESMEDIDPNIYLAAAPRYVEEQYAAKPGLRPIFERIVALVREQFPEVKISPCQTMVPLYRKNVFAQIKPATRTRLELGLCLKGYAKPLIARLIDTGGLQKGDRITHRFDLASADEVDAQVAEWLQIAWDLNA